VTHRATEFLASAGSPVKPEPAPEWDHSTLRLNKADVTLFQTLGDMAQRKPSLVLYSGEHSGTRFPLVGPRLQLGRAPDCDICLENPGISRRHAELRAEPHADGEQAVLHDLGSSNGTYVNDLRLEAPAVLADGDLVRLGNVVLKFYERHSLDALLHDRIYRLATVDSGTEVYTKKYLLEAMEREVKLARHSGRPLAALCMDLDHFKAVNDRYGHNAGDLVLRSAAAATQAVLRGSDILGRTGGEEFAIVLPDTDLRGAVELAERVRAAVAAQVFELTPAGAAQPLRHRQTASFGVAVFVPAMQAARDLLGAADAMLYAAKRQGRDCVSA
jgi:diguanylate cyclase (GGDEF)-like protein